MKIKSILTKSITAASFTLVGAAAFTTTNNVQASVVENDAAVYTVHTSTTVYNNYQNGAATGQVLAPNTSWKVIKTAYDAQGDKWYDLGKNQWVKAEKAVAVSTNAQAQTQANTQTQNTSVSTQAPVSQSPVVASNAYTTNVSGSEASAKAWIAGRESGGSYSARNGQYVGKYQLSSAYLGGDYSAANQERVADNYVKSRYGSWTAAKNFWQANGWY
ncbi:SLAP domain-containing protein [Lactobacillus agrestimuris]|uniref:aggregation-promoting factor n=1 Tax=Lactobacillus agrestimuris TaxID=2941328 RepID=UPI002042DA7A|nr:SLAP domain-containing protein [Lactobacillus agrestimuris]